VLRTDPYTFLHDLLQILANPLSPGPAGLCFPCVALLLLRHQILKWMTYSATALTALAPAVLVLAAIRLAWSPLSPWETTLVAASLSLIIAAAFEYQLKFLFGEYWPETWTQDNPSLIKDGAYGFHPLHFGQAYGSFPSGHTARACAAMSVIWLVYPMWRWFCVAICLSVIAGLVGMNYHFVGDTVGGAYLGSVTGAYTACFFHLGSGQKAKDLV
jgi:membrane-associated phospholipid phosphatase